MERDGRTLPHFLIIGGMKCGSTTLFRDLEEHPGVFFPLDKEPGNLCDDGVLTQRGLDRYAAHFRGAKHDAVCGEASTNYTKRPAYEGVPARAREALGPDLRLIYVMRDPIARLVSHHSHDGSRGVLPTDPEGALEQEPGLIEYSRYAYQLEPWIEAFGRGCIMAVRFEDYTEDRAAHAARVCAHIGVEPIEGMIDPSRVHNRSVAKPVPSDAWRAVINSSLYRNTIRRFIPRDVKDRLRHALLPKSTFTPDPLPRALVERLVTEFEQDQAHLRGLLGPDAPSWDLRARWLDDARSPA